MKSVAIVYWSGTGNTEAMAELILEGVKDAGGSAELIQAINFTPDQLDTFDAFAFGCPAMGDEELEDTEFLPMYDEIEPDLPGRKVAFFGSYDWNNGEWMEYWEQRAEEAGVSVADTVIAKDYPDEEASAECIQLGTMLAS
ncbi:MAG: flavodoxin [Eggerthellaceae bacterium]